MLPEIVLDFSIFSFFPPIYEYPRIKSEEIVSKLISILDSRQIFVKAAPFNANPTTPLRKLACILLEDIILQPITGHCRQ